jgi:NTE family protein
MTSLEGVLSASNAEPAGHPAVAGQVVLVMQGGGAQAAYQGGVYQALHEANLEPDWVIGTSIGAINGSIIAGNKVASRLERLREFWSRIESRPTWPSGPMFGNAANQLTTLLTGVPGFFSPNAAFLWGPEAAVGVEHAAMYIDARWQAGYVDTCRVIARRPWDNPIDPAVGVVVFASDANKNVL